MKHSLCSFTGSPELSNGQKLLVSLTGVCRKETCLTVLPSDCGITDFWLQCPWMIGDSFSERRKLRGAKELCEVQVLLQVQDSKLCLTRNRSLE